jgi:hypothetical protein
MREANSGTQFPPPRLLATRDSSPVRDIDGALDRVDDAGKLGEDAVNGGIDEPTVMLLDQRID